MRPKRI